VHSVLGVVGDIEEEGEKDLTEVVEVHVRRLADNGRKNLRRLGEESGKFLGRHGGEAEVDAQVIL